MPTNGMIDLGDDEEGIEDNKKTDIQKKIDLLEKQIAIEEANNSTVPETGQE